MRAFFCLVFASTVILAGAISYADESPTPMQLPQARPGAFYNVQLTIPPGLGYPFHCKPGGDPLPEGLTFDCERLQLNGRVLTNSEKNYNLTLEISDGQGNTKTFALVECGIQINDYPEPTGRA